MKHFQSNLLIVLALALCGLCAFQWYEQTVQRDEITTARNAPLSAPAAVAISMNIANRRLLTPLRT